ncbi:hypothetical protein HLK59_29430 [Streptomyces sp. S3(2020)]|nr:hypothetical protein [Streptomyces sp. S3(2020)]NNN34411.1 hypothetical protein [Streptomyces sp. S3(2020)]
MTTSVLYPDLPENGLIVLIGAFGVAHAMRCAHPGPATSPCCSTQST